MTVKFIYPWVLYCFWIIPVVYFWWFALNKHSRDRLKKFASAGMLKKLLPKATSRRFYWQSTFICIGLLLSLVAIARPQWGSKEQVFYQRGRDIMICLDVSRSMLATDVRPNRLERAKSDLLDLIYSLKGDRAGLIAFRNKANMICPLTIDYSYLRQALINVSPASAPRGETDIGAAIEKALASFDDEDPSHKAIMLVSDGEDLSGTAIVAAAKAKAKGIPIFTVGFGSRKGSMLPDKDNPDLKMKYDGKDVVSKLQHETLYKIANASGGSYIPVETASLTKTTLGDLYRDKLRNITAEDKEETVKRTYIERYQYFLIPALIFFMLATIFARGRLFRKKKMNKPELKQISILILLSLAAANVQAQQAVAVKPSQPIAPNKPYTYETNATPSEVIAEDEIIGKSRPVARKAQKYYDLGNYTKASDYYERAASSSATIEARDVYTYNAAVSSYKAGEFAEASLLFSAISSDGEFIDKALLFDNLGASYYKEADIGTNTSAAAYNQRMTSMRQASEAFQMSLRDQSDDYEAAQNFAVVFKKLPEVRNEAKVATVMEENKDAKPDGLVDKIWAEQKHLIEEIEIAMTNRNYTVITEMESIAKQQAANADLIIPLKVKLNEAASQQKQMTEQDKQGLQMLNQLIDSTQEKMNEASSKMKNLNTDAWRTAKIAESGIYNTWKTLAPFSKILGEMIQQQTNMVDKTVGNLQNQAVLSKDVLPVQTEIGALTELFEAKFTNAVPVGGTQQKQQQAPQGAAPGTMQMPMPQAGSSTNAAQQGINAETRAKIVELTQDVKRVQANAKQQMQQSSYNEALLSERESYRILKEIEELLPKQQNQDQQNQDQQNKDQKQKQDKDKNKDKDNKDSKQDQKDQNQPEQKPEDKKEEEKKEEPQPKEEKKKELSDDQVKQLLQKALQREAEHKEEKMKLNESMPLSPYEKDW
jgi:Ca-activated chloride channel family protein